MTGQDYAANVGRRFEVGKLGAERAPDSVALHAEWLRDDPDQQQLQGAAG